MEHLFKRLLGLRIRKRRRFRAKDGLCVILENSFRRNPVSDISMGGLSYYYMDNGLRPGKGSYELQVCVDRQTPLVHIPYTTVSDAETGSLLFDKQVVKRRSVRFERLSSRQRDYLRQLIKQYTCGRV